MARVWLSGSGVRLVFILLALCAPLGCASSGSSKKADAKPKRTVLLTSADDVRIGADASRQVATEIGALDDSNLVAYVDGIGRKLLRGLPRTEDEEELACVLGH